MYFARIVHILKTKRFSLENEKRLHEQIAKTLKDDNIPFGREYVLDDGNHVDFMFPDGICMEVKIMGAKKGIYKQCYRYSEFEKVKELILLTNVSMGTARLYNNKPFHVINLSSAWL